MVCSPKLTLRKIHVFVREKYVEVATHDEKHVPDLLEWIRRPPGLVKEELRLVLMKMRIQNLKIQGFSFSDPGNPPFSRWRPMPAFSLVSFRPSEPEKIKEMHVLSAGRRLLP